MSHTPDNLDRILSAEAPLQASSGFAASVMDRIRDEASAPAPIPFPWQRFLPAFMLAGAVLLGCAILLIRAAILLLPSLLASSATIPLPAWTPELAGLLWGAGTLLLSYLCWRLALALTRSSSIF